MGRVTIILDDEYTGGIETVAGKLRQQGLHDDEVLESLGMITGDVEPEQRDSLESIQGVAAVQDDVAVQLPPPDSPVQ